MNGYFCGMNKAKIWISAFRLRTLPLSMSGIIFGSAVAFSQGFWNASIFIFACTTTLCFQVLSNLANDLGDHLKGTDNEERVGPTRATQSGEITANQMKNAVIVFIVLSILSAGALIYLSSQSMSSDIIMFYVLLGVASIVAALLYTLGKKAYGYHGLGDIFVFVFFGLVSVLGVYNLYSPFFDFHNVYPAIGLGLLSTAVLNLNNLRDHVNDKKMNKNTLVVKLGIAKAKVYHTFLILGAFLSFLLFFLQTNKYTFLVVLLFIPLLFHLKKVLGETEMTNLDPELKKVALLTFFISLSTGIILILF